jgi:hypothetical protein
MPDDKKFLKTDKKLKKKEKGKDKKHKKIKTLMAKSLKTQITIK